MQLDQISTTQKTLLISNSSFSENQDIEINRLKEEYKNLQPLELPNGITVLFEGDFNCVDGKTLNKMTDNNCTRRCPYCHLLPREYMKKGTDGYEFSAKCHLSTILDTPDT